MKVCSRCKEEKDLSSFGKNKRSVDGYRIVCKACRNTWEAEYREKNRVRVNSISKRWWDNNPNKSAIGSARNRKHRLGITQTQYKYLLYLQDNKCFICSKTKEEEGRELSVDHCHKTDLVRGILCSSCNFLVGQVEAGTLKHRQQLLAYIAMPACEVLGVRIEVKGSYCNDNTGGGS